MVALMFLFFWVFLGLGTLGAIRDYDSLYEEFLRACPMQPEPFLKYVLNGVILTFALLSTTSFILAVQSW